MEERCDGIVKVKSSVEYLCGLLQVLGVTNLSPEHIRKAKFNHPSAASPLLHALHHLVSLISSSPPPLHLQASLSSNGVPSPVSLNFRRALNHSTRFPYHDPEASSASSSTSCCSEQNGNHADLLVHQKKKSRELKHASQPRALLASKAFPARLSTFIPSSANGRRDASLCGKNSKLKSFTRCDSSASCDAQLDRKTLLHKSSSSSSLSSSSSSFDCRQGEFKHAKSPDLERDLNVKHGNGDHATICDKTHLISHRGRSCMPGFANARKCNTGEPSGLNNSYKESSGEAPRKYGCSHTASKYGNGRASHVKLTNTDVLSIPKNDTLSAELPISYASCMASSMSSMRDDYGAQNGVIFNHGTGKWIVKVSSASCTPEQYSIEDANEKLDYVKFYMAQWGYPDNWPFLAIAKDAQQSRSLLLAMAWMLTRFNVFRRTLMCHVEPLMLSRTKAPLPPYPADVSFTREALEIGKEAEESARAHVRKLLQSLDSMADVKMRAAARTQQALMLYGKVVSCIKNLQSLRLCKARLHRELDELEMEKKILHPVNRSPLSQYEVHLLQHQEDLQLHLDALQAEGVVNEKARELQKHESLFQKWMESVVDLCIAEGSFNDVSDIQIMDFKEQLTHRQEQEGNGCEVSLVRQVNMSTGAPNEGLRVHFSTGKMLQQKDGVETLQLNVSDMYAEPILSRIQLTESETVANSRACSVAEKIQRLTYLATGVNQVLTSTHSRAMLHEALGPVLNDRSQFYFGLQKDGPLYMSRLKTFEGSGLSNGKSDPV